MTISPKLTIATIFLSVATATVLSGVSAAAQHADELPCAADFQISVPFNNGAAWRMCRTHNDRENLVLSDISYKPPGGEFYPVMGSMRLSQLHVTYDDSNVTYNDVTQYGLGAEFMVTLLAEDCPGGELLPALGRAGVCLSHQGPGGHHSKEQFRDETEHATAHSFTLTSISQVGSYSYSVSWRFFADGSLSPSVGAAGALQRSSTDVNSPFGRQLEGSPAQSWLSHTHNYYWRLDFDLGTQADDDYVRERSLLSEASGLRRQQHTPLHKEAARETSPEIFRAWEIVDGGSHAEPEQQIAYSLEPINQGHKHVRAEREPYTQYDFFVTRQNDCERFASQNSRFNPGCADDVLAFVNDESIIDSDIVIWHRVSFHHVPRNEDQGIMHSHWDGFTLRPRHLQTSTPGHSGSISNHPPVFEIISDVTQTTNTSVSLAVNVSDADADQLTLTAQGLPPGVTLSGRELTGTTTTAGEFEVTLTASDGAAQSDTSFRWTIVNRKKSGAAGPMIIAALSLLYLVTAWHALWQKRRRNGRTSS